MVHLLILECRPTVFQALFWDVRPPVPLVPITLREVAGPLARHHSGWRIANVGAVVQDARGEPAAW